MAAIQNDRDVLLQSASVRVVVVASPELEAVIAATKGVKITAPSNVFQITTGGAASPSSITMTAELALLPPSSTVTWDLTAGTATLTGSGLTRTLAAVNMASRSVTVRVRVQEGVGTPVYTAYWTIAKTADGMAGTDGVNGTNGPAGADGQRGTITAFGTLPDLVAYPARSSGRARWAAGSATPSNATAADNVARNVIWQFMGNAGSAPSNVHLRLGDTVTLTDSAQTVSATGYWTGANWDTPGTVIDGNLLVGGNVSGQVFTGGEFIGASFATADSGRRAELFKSGPEAHSLVFYTGVGSGSVMRLTSDGRIFAASGGAGYVADFQAISGTGVRGVSASDGTGVLGQANGTGTGVWGESASANGVYGKSRGSGAGGAFESATGPAVRMIAVTALPTTKPAGGMCYHTTHGLCFSDGTNWIKLTGTVVT